MSIDFKTHEYASQLNAIARAVETALHGSGDAELVRIAERMTSELAAHRADESIRIAFVGQYSAGKSTMISALTGRRDIDIDADIATSKATTYLWTEGLSLVDTPGIYTERREHDAVTEEALRSADLVVFCITYSLFDDVTGPNFRVLAFERGYAPKLMLVVNKMSSEAGEHGALVLSYEESLDASLAPRSVREFRRVFVDAKDYVEGVDEDDPELVEESRFAELIAALNSMATEQGVLGKLDTPGRIVLGAVDEAEATAASPEGVDKGFLLVLDRLARVVRNERLQFRAEMRALTLSLSADIEAVGAELAAGAGRTKDFEGEASSAAKRVETLVEQASGRASNVADHAATSVQEEIGRVLEGALVSAMFEPLRATEPDVGFDGRESPDLNLLRSRMQQLQQIGSAVSGKIFAAAQGPAGKAAEGFLKAGHVAGSNMHSVVYGVGKFLGYKFRPWEAVNIAKNVGNVAKVVGPILAVAAVAFDVYVEHKENKQEEDLSRVRREIEGSFRALARNVEREFEKNFRDNVEENVFDVADAAVASARTNFEATSRVANDLQARLRVARRDLQQLLASTRSPAQV